jgi:acyl-CoA thioester hydrolase
MSEAHVFPLRVYYEDTDAGGIVFYANYLKYAERARTEMLREVGIESSALMDQDKIILTVRRCAVEYLKSARLDDALEIHSRITKVGGASMQGEQRIKCDGEDIVEIQIKLACTTMDGKPTRLPKRLRETFNNLVSE